MRCPSNQKRCRPGQIVECGKRLDLSSLLNKGLNGTRFIDGWHGGGAPASVRGQPAQPLPRCNPR